MSSFIADVRHAASSLSDIALNSASTGGVGYLASRAYAILAPATYGAAFAALAILVAKVATPFWQVTLGGSEATSQHKFAANVLGLATGIAVAAAVATYGAAISLTATTLAGLAAVVFGTQGVVALHVWLSQPDASESDSEHPSQSALSLETAE